MICMCSFQLMEIIIEALELVALKFDMGKS
jgi:hypothetical protein